MFEGRIATELILLYSWTITIQNRYLTLSLFNNLAVEDPRYFSTCKLYFVLLQVNFGIFDEN